MNTGLLTLLSVLGTHDAVAQSLDLLDEGIVLPRGAPGTYLEHNVGSPTVTYDADTDRFVMFFEYRGDWGVPSRCAGSAGTTWGIGRATSSDGLHWTADAAPVLEPLAGTFWGCAAVHPTVVYEGPGRWHLWFKAFDESGVTGIGYASSADGVSWTTSLEPALSVHTDPTPEDFGWPRVVQVSGTWLLFMNYGDNGITVATAREPGGPFAWEGPRGRTALGVGSASWMEDELIVADIACRDEPADHPFDLVFGSHDRDPGDFWGAPLSRSIAWATGHGVEDWTLPDAPITTWSQAEILDHTAWRSWSALPIGDADYLFFYQQHDGVGNQVGLAHTLPSTSWDRSQIRGDVCIYDGAPPQAAGDAYAAGSGETLVVGAPGVLANDVDPERNLLTVTLVDGPASGTVTLDDDGGFTYVAPRRFEGVDTFTYVASDGASDSLPVTVEVTVTEPDCRHHPGRGRGLERGRGHGRGPWCDRR